MSVTEASLRVLAVALTAGMVAYAYSYWYFRFASSRAGQVTKGTRFLLRLLALPPAIIVVGAFAVPVLDKPLFKLICDTALLFFGTPISIILFCVPALLKMNAARRIVWVTDGPERLSRGQLRAVVLVLYFVALFLWFMPLRATHAQDVALMLIVAVGVTVLRFGWGLKIVARVSGDDKAFVAHSSLVMGGILLLALAGVLVHLQLSASALALLVWAFIASSYAFAIVLPLGAYYGQRGLTSKPPFQNRVVYFGNMIGAIGMLVGTVVLLWGAYGAL